MQNKSNKKEYIVLITMIMISVLTQVVNLVKGATVAQKFGATVAMGNAHPQIKKVAKYVTKSNAEDGVAYLIEMLLKRRAIKEDS